MILVNRVDYLHCPKCPTCSNILKYKDTKTRKLFDYGHEFELIKVRRFKCDVCNKMHSELPDSVVPGRHYKKEVIKDVLEHWIEEDDPIAENGPANITMQRWRKEINADIIRTDEKSI